ncbi:TPA: hypothetical protein HA265_07240, partial [Candidatus Woesearchaeota archaeon]|nr:hypothetical protein [Candidatus Woesearchaeota archaeon]
MKTIYTNIIGAFVFEDSNLVDERLFSKEEVRENYGNLGKGETKQEKELLKKHPDAKAIEATQQTLEFFSDNRYLEKLREANIIITRKKVSLSVMPDHLIVQSINSMDEMDKIANTMAKRLREWYELYNPEFSHNIEDHEKFVKLVLTKTKSELLKEVNVKEEETMGAEVDDRDLKAMREFASELDALYAARKKQADYITESMKKHYPNITAICGAMIAAKLLSIAGSLQKMAMMPASTIQLLGAEKALF